MKEKDIYKDTPLRLLGYTNEVGEACRPLVHRSVVNLSYVIATGYVCADAIDKTYKEYDRSKNLSKSLIKGADTLIWQMLASVAIPGFTVNRITSLAGYLVRQAQLAKPMQKSLPTIVGLCSIPFIIYPIDQFTSYLMDETIRKIYF